MGNRKGRWRDGGWNEELLGRLVSGQHLYTIDITLLCRQWGMMDRIHGKAGLVGS